MLEALSYGAINLDIWLIPLLRWLPWLRDRPIRFALVMFGILGVRPALLATGVYALRHIRLFSVGFGTRCQPHGTIFSRSSGRSGFAQR